MTRKHQQQLTVGAEEVVHAHVCGEELNAIMLNSKTLLILLFLYSNYFRIITGHYYELVQGPNCLIWSMNVSLLDLLDHRNVVLEGDLKYHILQTPHFTDEEK